MVSTLNRCGTGFLRWLYYAFLFACIVASHAKALDPNHHLSQYAHTAWRIQDGIFSGSPWAITQTKDGYIWIGTRSGLVRFDGLRFVEWTSPDGKSVSHLPINCLLGSQDGSLWIGTRTGLSRLANQQLTAYRDANGIIATILESHSGVWFTLVDNSHNTKICQVVGTGIKCYGKEEGFSGIDMAALLEYPSGSFWAAGHDSLLRWNTHTSNRYEISSLKSHLGQGVVSISRTPDGSLWVGIQMSGPHLGLQKLEHGKWKPFVTRGFDSSNLIVASTLVDRAGSLWVATYGQGLYRIHGDTVERFRSTDGLSSDSMSALYEDREGTIWAATSKGVDSFHDTRVTSVSFPPGSAAEVDGVLASKDDTLWIARDTSLDFIRHGKLSSLTVADGVPGKQVTSLLEDHAGRLWVGVDRTLSVFWDGKFHPIKQDDGQPIGAVVGMAEDTENNVWAETIASPRMLFRIRDFRVLQKYPAPEMPAARKVAADPGGGIWLGLTSGDLARYRQGKLDVFAYPHASPHPAVRQLTVNLDGSVFGATPDGLVAWKNGKQQILTTRNGLPCESIYAQTLDHQGSLWLYTECGLIKIADNELKKWWEHADTRLETTLFDSLDGVHPEEVPFNGSALTSDGQIWLASSLELQTLDPSQSSKNTVSPPVHVEMVVADKKEYPYPENLKLPPLTRDLQIDYTALSLVVPQKVRFRYKLEGHDTDWQEAGTRRQAFYTDLAPKKYRFRVIACNNDGLWNEEGATLTFSIAPAWYQTNWFLVLCLVVTLFVVWSAYRLRLRQLERVVNARFDERLAERTRIAREIHDTLVQTIQGSRMVADNALIEATDFARMRKAMERLSVWLGQATREGREALNSLRSSTIETNDLAESFQRALQDCRLQGFQDVNFAAEGKTAEMHPIVRDEIYLIGYEAIRNACQHSGGNRLNVKLSYSHDLTLRVSDNGQGIDPQVAVSGKGGHYGLQGMRERALRISGKLRVDSSPDSGTTIELIVPGRIVFQSPRSTWPGMLRAVNDLLHGSDKTYR